MAGVVAGSIAEERGQGLPVMELNKWPREQSAEAPVLQSWPVTVLYGPNSQPRIVCP